MKTILVVDDDFMIRDLVDTILMGSVFETIICSSGEEAIPFIDEADALVTDFKMLGGMNGVELIAIAKRKNSNIPALLMTGTPFDEIPANLADSIIKKPFDNIGVIPEWLLEVLPEEVTE